MSALLLADARLVDPASGRDERGSVLVRDGVIADVAWGAAPAAPDGAEVVDCAGHVVAPGLVDLRAFVGEPGAEHRETLKSASAAAAAGGVTTLVCMPDTHPPIDDPAIVDFVLRRARDTAVVNIRIAAALTKGLEGREMTEIGLLGEAGAVAFTDGARSVANAQVMRRALTYARDFGALIMHHVEDADLVGDGVMNDGELASRLGLLGIPREAETLMLERDMRLVRLTGARYHAALISCADSVALVRRAKADGLPVTCGVSINNLALNENDIGDYRTFLKLSPPLRHEDDRQAVIAALADGVIDVVVSDHNPQDVETKRLPFAEAADGAVGLETLLSAALRLVHAGDMPLPKLLHALATRPADILGLPGGRLTPGAPADLILVDIDAPYVLDKRELHSRSKNSPFDEARLQGRVLKTFVGGRLVHGRSVVPGEPQAQGRGPSSADDSWIPFPLRPPPPAGDDMPHSMNWSLDAPYFLAALVFGYLLGSIPFGLVFTRLAGLGDVRKIGSGNIGATNVLRTGRKGLAAATLLADALKGTLAVAIAWQWGANTAVLAAFGAVLGHLFPVWLGFKGGKGVATFLGCLLALKPAAALAFAVLWLAVAAAMRYSSLAALIASAATPAVLWAMGERQMAELFIVLVALLWWKHRENIKRLAAGSEGRIGQKG